MSESKKRPKPSASNLFKYLSMGYTLREIIKRGLGLKVYSVLSHFIIPFGHRGSGTMIAPSVIVDGARHISVGSHVWLQRSVWLSVPLLDMKTVPSKERMFITIEDGCQIGPHCTISAFNKIHIKKDVLLAPNIMIVDHAHNYENPELPILHQGLSQVGSVVIEENCWISTNVVIAASQDRQITIGRNSVVAANSVVRHSIPPYSVASGNPAAVIKQYDFNLKKWVSVSKSH